MTKIIIVFPDWREWPGKLSIYYLSINLNILNYLIYLLIFLSLFLFRLMWVTWKLSIYYLSIYLGWREWPWNRETGKGTWTAHQPTDRAKRNQRWDNKEIKVKYIIIYINKLIFYIIHLCTLKALKLVTAIYLSIYLSSNIHQIIIYLISIFS